MKTPIDIYLEREREFDSKLLNDWVNQIDLDDILAVKNFNKATLLTILKNEVEIERVKKQKIPPYKTGDANYGLWLTAEGYNASKQDTIDRLEAEITKLEQL